jgi:hypothetical protein
MTEDTATPDSALTPRNGASSPRIRFAAPKRGDDPNQTTNASHGAGSQISIAEAVNRIDRKGKGKGRDFDYASLSGASTPVRAYSNCGSPPLSRTASIASVHFRQPRDPALPQGVKKPHGGHRIRDASPPHRR